MIWFKLPCLLHNECKVLADRAVFYFQVSTAGKQKMPGMPAQFGIKVGHP